MSIGLRIDVDTYRGTRDGIPRLLEILQRHSVRATWFVSLGPDNMGRHIRRMLKPAFAVKMMRSGAPNLYGWEILLRGTIWPGPMISSLKEQLLLPERAGHEVGIHAWDHHAWQMGIDSLSDELLSAQLERACAAFESVYDRAPTCAAAPGWRCTPRVLDFARSREFAYRSDCRGAARAFSPVIRSTVLNQPQVPVDLPTYDEGVGRSRDADARWNDHLLGLLHDGTPHVLTIHAEAEGGSKAELFAQFLKRALSEGHEFEPLSDWLTRQSALPSGKIAKGSVAGREGWVCVASELDG